MSRHGRRVASRFVTLDRSLCEACWECVAVCPESVIGKVDVWRYRHAVIHAGDRCLGCLRCVKVCASGALSARDNGHKVLRMAFPAATPGRTPRWSRGAFGRTPRPGAVSRRYMSRHSPARIYRGNQTRGSLRRCHSRPLKSKHDTLRYVLNQAYTFGYFFSIHPTTTHAIKLDRIMKGVPGKSEIAKKLIVLLSAWRITANQILRVFSYMKFVM